MLGLGADMFFAKHNKPGIKRYEDQRNEQTYEQRALAGPGRLAGSGAGGGLIEVLSGVAPGDTLLVDPTGVLAIGAPIQVRS